MLFGFSSNYIELILRVENSGVSPMWIEAEIHVPENLSLSPNNSLRKGRLRIGIVSKSEFLEKSTRIYSNSLTNPKMYRCNVTLYSFSKDGVIENRVDKPINIRCEIKKQAAL